MNQTQMPCYARHGSSSSVRPTIHDAGRARSVTQQPHSPPPQSFDVSANTRNHDHLETLPYANIPSNVWIESDGVKVLYLDDNMLSHSRSRDSQVRDVDQAGTATSVRRQESADTMTISVVRDSHRSHLRPTALEIPWIDASAKTRALIQDPAPQSLVALGVHNSSWCDQLVVSPKSRAPDVTMPLPSRHPNPLFDTSMLHPRKGAHTQRHGL
jgi:hypothetical protein